MAQVILRHIHKTYNNENFAVHDFNLTIADKEFVVLVGPSGCGKSTVLNLIAGLEEITAGELYIDGRLVNDIEPQHRDIAMVFQSYALYPHMTVYDNMAFALKIKRVPKDEINSRVKEAAKILGLSEFLTRKPKALSGGQRQRVAIGRAIVRDPKVFLMDEPLSNLDAKLRNQMRAEIIRLRQKINTTFIYVTHDQTEAMTLGDRIIIMKDGVIQQVGTPQQVYNRPANIFTSGFIGIPQMNFIEAMLEIHDGKYFVNMDGKLLSLPPEKQQNLTHNNINPQRIYAGIRPENIFMNDDHRNNFSLSGVVDISEMLGSTINLHVRTLNTNIVISVQTMNLMQPRKTFNTGEEIQYSLDGRYIHIFGHDNGENLEYAR